ncbi:cyclic nucleotide-binding isoform C [Micractinium conductrix]|uniref:Cyclic nucleotide-binding isoform C n=1 Tax=Micractinium conductrix TaxID=554055 RepID=A0A2P6V546_9CHLO|nr:cyclic nucleotide-binding isoform C [Micractinium conductrix]|eukprot:PSC69211.1 cyclic nucleotide-binding isoform C [Micractinium conductrix]
MGCCALGGSQASPACRATCLARTPGPLGRRSCKRWRRHGARPARRRSRPGRHPVTGAATLPPGALAQLERELQDEARAHFYLSKDPEWLLEWRCLQLRGVQAPQTPHALLYAAGRKLLPPWWPGATGSRREQVAAFEACLHTRPHVFRLVGGGSVAPAPGASGLLNPELALTSGSCTLHVEVGPYMDPQLDRMARTDFERFCAKVLLDCVYLSRPTAHAHESYLELRPFQPLPSKPCPARWSTPCAFEQFTTDGCRTGPTCPHEHAPQRGAPSEPAGLWNEPRNKLSKAAEAGRCGGGPSSGSSGGGRGSARRRLLVQKAFLRFIKDRPHLLRRSHDGMQAAPGAAGFLRYKCRLPQYLMSADAKRAPLSQLQALVSVGRADLAPELEEQARADYAGFCRACLSDCVWVPEGGSVAHLRPVSKASLAVAFPKPCPRAQEPEGCALGDACPLTHAPVRGQAAGEQPARKRARTRSPNMEEAVAAEPGVQAAHAAAAAAEADRGVWAADAAA